MECKLDANIVKIADSISLNPEITVNRPDGGADRPDPYPVRFLAGVRRTLDPVGEARKRSEADAIAVRSVCENYELYRKTMPSLTEPQALLLAAGHTLSPSGARNVLEVLSMAPQQDERADPSGLTDEFKDGFIEGSANAYDEEVRQMWAKLLIEEGRERGSFSKRMLATLGSMDGGLARAFSTLCSYSIASAPGERPVAVLSKVAGEGWSYNRGAITVDQLHDLAALGLVDCDVWTSFTLEPHTAQSFWAAGAICFHVLNMTDSTQKFQFGNLLFLPTGRALSKLCELGGAPDIREMAGLAISNKSLTISDSLGPLG